MPTTLAADAFGRTTSAGSWGSADTGGAWTLTDTPAVCSVSGDKGRMAMVATYNREAILASISTNSIEGQVDFSTDSAMQASAQACSLILKKMGSLYYSARVRIESGLLRLRILRDEAEIVASSTITHNYVAGDVIRVKARSVTTAGTTTVQAKMWRVAGSVTEAEPGSWQLSGTDSTAGYQVAGNPGIRGVLSSGAANATFFFDDLTFVDPSNTVPVANAGADFAVVRGQPFQLNGSATDADGTVASVAWAQVSGTATALTSTTALKPYGTAPDAVGTLVYGLTATDNSGATSTQDTVTVTVADPPTGGSSSGYNRRIFDGTNWV